MLISLASMCYYYKVALNKLLVWLGVIGTWMYKVAGKYIKPADGRCNKTCLLQANLINHGPQYNYDAAFFA